VCLFSGWTRGTPGDPRRDFETWMERARQYQGFAPVACPYGFDERKFLCGHRHLIARLGRWLPSDEVSEQRFFAWPNHGDQIGGLCHQHLPSCCEA